MTQLLSPLLLMSHQYFGRLRITPRPHRGFVHAGCTLLLEEHTKFKNIPRIYDNRHNVVAIGISKISYMLDAVHFEILYFARPCLLITALD